MCFKFIMKPQNICLTNTNEQLPTPFSQTAPAIFSSSIQSPSHLFGIHTVLDRLTYKILGKIYLLGLHPPWPLSVFCKIIQFFYIWLRCPICLAQPSFSWPDNLPLSHEIPLSFSIPFNNNPHIHPHLTVVPCLVMQLFGFFFNLPLGQTAQTFSHGKKKK